MGRIQTVTLIGLGAIGAAYGSKLHDYLGKNFTIVANEERISRYKKNGIQIVGDRYDFYYETPGTSNEPRDLVIFAVKNAELEQAITEVQHHIGPDTIILSLLNGVSSEEVIREKTGNKHILYSMCVGIDAVREAQHISFSNLGRICFGARDETLAGDVAAVKALFDAAGVPYKIPEDIWHEIWAKFMFNVGVNQTSALLGASYSFFQQIPALHQWMEEAMMEVVAVSHRIGVNLNEKDIAAYRPILHALSPDGKTSMLQDIEGHRKTEVEYFAGEVVKLGRMYHVPTPINDQLLRLLPIIEEMNRIKTAAEPS